MKPLGTITLCFPHVDENTQSILQSVMEMAENFAGFTEELCKHVCSQSVSPSLEYLAFFFACHLGNYNLSDKLKSAGKLTDMAEPLYLSTQSNRDHFISWDEMNKSMRRALEEAPNDWLASHIYLTWRSWVVEIFPESDIDVKPMDVISSNIDINSDLAFFKSHLLRIEAGVHFRDHERNQAINLLNDSLAIARKFDEQIMIGDILVKLANLTKHTDLKKAINLLVSGRELSETLGYKQGISQVQHELSHIMGFRGEYNAAIEHLDEYFRLCESLGLTNTYTNSVMALHLNQMRDGEEALKRAKIALELSKHPARRRLAFTHAQMAWALINLGRLDEAEEELTYALEDASKSGEHRQVIYHHIVEGILFKAKKNYEAAITTFIDVLKFFEKDPVPVWLNVCYLNLAEIEVETLADQSASDSSRPWMNRLIQHTQKYDLPGISAQARLLDAKLHYRYGDIIKVREILSKVQKIGEASGMKYLNDLVVSMFPDIVLA